MQLELFLWRKTQHIWILEIEKVRLRLFVREIRGGTVNKLNLPRGLPRLRDALRIYIVVRVKRKEFHRVDPRVHEMSEFRSLHPKRELKRIPIHREHLRILNEPLLVNHCRILSLEHLFENEKQSQSYHAENHESQHRSEPRVVSRNPTESQHDLATE